MIGSASGRGNWPAADVYEFIGAPLTKTVEDLAPQAQAATPTRRTTRGLKAAGFDNSVHYIGFRKNGAEYRINDCVYMETDEQDQPYKGKIMTCYRDERGEDKIRVRWLYTAEDAKKSRSTKKKTLPTDPNEIFYSNESDPTEIENVIGRFEVLPKEEFDKKFPDGKAAISDAGNVTYFCRRVWEERQDRLGLPVPWQTFVDNVDLVVQVSDPFVVASARKRKIPPASVTSGAGKKPRIVRPPRRDISKDDEDDGAANDDSDEENFAPSDDGQTSEPSDTDGVSETFSDDDSEAAPFKRRRIKAVPKRRTPRKPPTPRTPKGRRSRITAETPSKAFPRFTPSRRSKLPATPLPARVHDCASPASEYDRALERLHVANLPDALPCREMEFAEIYGHIESAIEDGSGSCIYIAGVPGIGKTATVHAVMRSLQDAMDEEEISPFQFVEINGMKLTEPAQAYSILWKALTGNKVSATHAGHLLEKRFQSGGPNRQPVVVLMDELDLLVTKNQQVMYNFFNWPNLPNSRLIVLAVANTMDLPERVLTNRVSSRLGLIRIQFEAYTHSQLLEIVQSRLEGVECFEKDAIELCARKIGAVSGDARRALDICRRGVELLEQSLSAAEAENRPTDKKLVTMSVIDRAVKEMFAQPAVQSVARASTHQRVFLTAVLKVVRRLGMASVEFADVADEHLKLCKLGGVPEPRNCDLVKVCEELGTARLLITEASRAGYRTQRLQIAGAVEDVVAAVRNAEEGWLARLCEG
ncbi:Origin recognition complex, subunit 1 [Geranomyces michiganensis]|nr:Origin recognition complex, subunit 1 [Geranomyces michiganensis]